MRYLIDTHAFIWAMTNPVRLSPTAASLLVDPTNEIVVSVISLWEIEIKSALGKMPQMVGLENYLKRDKRFLRFKVLDLTRGHVHAVAGLPHHHGDPFDRALIAQASYEGLVLVTVDSQFGPYNVTTIW